MPENLINTIFKYLIFYAYKIEYLLKIHLEKEFICFYAIYISYCLSNNDKYIVFYILYKYSHNL